MVADDILLSAENEIEGFHNWGDFSSKPDIHLADDPMEAITQIELGKALNGAKLSKLIHQK